jgi:hypothetical protein
LVRTRFELRSETESLGKSRRLTDWHVAP